MHLIVTGRTNATTAAKRATSTIPIVMASGADPVAVGVAPSLRQPGGNFTGMTSMNRELAGKRLELLRNVAPRASRIAIVWDERNGGNRFGVNDRGWRGRGHHLILTPKASERPAADDPARWPAAPIDRHDAADRRLQRYVDVGVRHMMVNIQGDTLEQTLARMQRFPHRIMPLTA